MTSVFRPDVDWPAFFRLIDKSIPVARNIRAFQEGLNAKIREYKKDHQVKNGDLIYDVIPIQNSTWYLLSIGGFSSSEVTVVARPTGKFYDFDDGEWYEDFKAQKAVLDQDNLVIAGQAYYASNAKHPAIMVYHRWANWVLSNLQIADFEAGVDSFVKRGDRWTIYASGRTYPKHIEVSHGAAQVLMERTFVESKGQLLTSFDMFRPSVMHYFDELIAASQNKNWAKVRSLCASPELARRFQKLTQDAPREDWLGRDGEYQKMQACRIPKTHLVGIMEKVESTWKLTKIRSET